MMARAPLAVDRLKLDKPIVDVSAFPLVSHARDGFTVVELADGDMRPSRHLTVPHQHAMFLGSFLCVAQDEAIVVYNYQKERSIEVRERIELGKEPIELLPWWRQFVIVRFADHSVARIDLGSTNASSPVAELQSVVPISKMGTTLSEVVLFGTDGFHFWDTDTNSTPVVFRTASPPSMVQLVRGKVIVGEENGTVRELARAPDGFLSKRSVQLPGSPIAVTGTKSILFVACRNGALAVIDWRDDARFILKRVRQSGHDFTAFAMYGEQGYGVVGGDAIVRYNPTPGSKLAIQISAIALALLGAGAVYWLVAVRRERSALRYVLLLIVGVFYVRYLRQITNPIEALHYVEYGMLGILGARGMRHHLADQGVYPAAFLICTLTGLTDEIIQWLHPARTGDLRDVFFNMKSAGLMLIAFALGVPMRTQTFGFGAASRRVFGWMLFVTAVYFGAFIHNVNEFGYKIEVSGVGTFVSRHSAEELRAIDSQRGEELAGVLQAQVDVPYGESLEQLQENKFFYELRVHLFRRDAHFNRASYLVAYKENRLIDAYFSNTVSRTSYDWPDEKAQKCLNEIGSQKDASYHSPVSAEVITSYGPLQLWLVVAAVCLGCIVLVARKT